MNTIPSVQELHDEIQRTKPIVEELQRAWPPVLDLIRDYDSNFPYASMDGDDEKVYRMVKAMKELAEQFDIKVIIP